MANLARLSNEYSGEEHEDFFTHLQFSPYLVDQPDANTTYICFESGAGTIYLKKVSVAGDVTTIQYAYDTWANRATASYSPIND